MANRRLTQFHYSLHAMPVLLDCNVAIGATGAVGATKGPGIASVTRKSAGVYAIKLQDNYFKFYNLRWNFEAPVTGSDVADGSFVSGTTYIITAVGTTNWTAIGLPAGITAAVGMSFTATGVGGAGTGTAKAVGTSGIFAVEVVGDPNLQLGPVGPGNQGATIMIKCLDASAAATDPASGSKMHLEFYLSNSSVQVQGE
jgi:hypothetical protein